MDSGSGLAGTFRSVRGNGVDLEGVELTNVLIAKVGSLIKFFCVWTKVTSVFVDSFLRHGQKSSPKQRPNIFFFAIRKLHRILTIHCTFPPHFLRAPAPRLKGADTCTQLVARPRVPLPDLRLWRTNITQHFLPPSSLPPPQKKENQDCLSQYPQSRRNPQIPT